MTDITAIKKVISDEFADDFASLAKSQLGVSFNVAAAQAAVTDTFINDLLDTNSDDEDKLHMAHTVVGSSLYGKYSNNAIAALLVPVDKKDAVIRATQKKFEETYHVPGSYVDCATADSGWITRGVQYISVMGFGGGPEMKDILPVEDGMLQRPPSQANDAGGLEQCSTATKNDSKQIYTMWNLSDQTIQIGDQSFYILLGAITAEEDKSVSREKMTTGTSHFGTYYPGTLAKFKSHSGF